MESCDAQNIVPELSNVLRRVRDLVQAFLDDGVTPSQVSAVMVYAATELGLCVAEEPIQVFPVVLDAIASAVRAKAAAKAGAPDECLDAGLTVDPPEGKTLH
jgi:hypothetical protein